MEYLNESFGKRGLLYFSNKIILPKNKTKYQQTGKKNLKYFNVCLSKYLVKIHGKICKKSKPIVLKLILWDTTLENYSLIIIFLWQTDKTIIIILLKLLFIARWGVMRFHFGCQPFKKKSSWCLVNNVQISSKIVQDCLL